MPDGPVILRFVESAMTQGAALQSDRDAVRQALGDEGFVDVCAVMANFCMMTRVADATGIPLDAGLGLATEKMRADTGINEFVSATKSPSAGPLQRAVGRALAPVVPAFFKLVSAARRSRS